MSDPIYLLNNEQRKYLGLDPIGESWDLVTLKSRVEDCYLYFDGNVLKRQIFSNGKRYSEHQYNDPTEDRQMLLPKTKKGKKKKLNFSNLEGVRPQGVYFVTSEDFVMIANYATQTTFFSSRYDPVSIKNFEEFDVWLDGFIQSCPENYLSDIEAFKTGKRRNLKYKVGDVFAFKLGRDAYCYGKIIDDIIKV